MEWQDSTCPITWRQKQELKPMWNIWNWKGNGPITFTTTTTQTSLHRLVHQLSPKSILWSWFKTLVWCDRKAGTGISWMKLILTGSMKRNERKLETVKLFPLTSPMSSARDSSSHTSTSSMKKFRAHWLQLVNNSTSRPTMPKLESDDPLY